MPDLYARFPVSQARLATSTCRYVVVRKGQNIEEPSVRLRPIPAVERKNCKYWNRINPSTVVGSTTTMPTKRRRRRRWPFFKFVEQPLMMMIGTYRVSNPMCTLSVWSRVVKYDQNGTLYYLEMMGRQGTDVRCRWWMRSQQESPFLTVGNS